MKVLFELCQIAMRAFFNELLKVTFKKIIQAKP